MKELDNIDKGCSGDMSRHVRLTVAATLLLTMALIATSCGGRQARDSWEAGVADAVCVETDSIVGLPEMEATVPMDTAWVYRRFANAREARDYMASSADSSKYAAGILTQMAKDCLPYAEKLINSRYGRFIIVDKWAMKVRLFDRYGRMEREYKMACAKNFGTKHKKADSRTPEGFFSVEGIYDSTDWLFTDDDGVTSDKKGQFGPRFIRLRIPNTSQIGIHGTCAPWSLGGRVSHGCIRIANENILELVTLVEKGMPVIVNPGRRDTRVNMEEGYDIPWISSSHDPRYAAPKVVPKPAVESDTVMPAHVAADSIHAVPVTPADTLPGDVATDTVTIQAP